ncbi:uncharacterized protein si:dkeyp-50b9.1 isoform X1 [Callorhinchus milii]|uniref:Uncharacterized LOC103185922 n=1 Tax=Callorhinchus milii TaxID=7868 RepID=V9KNL8_CALMI|nr:uncharacterized protein si:dkeyp-50b9.1 isoform X1 [Callorhinchus milii]|eukprot:gi/632972870/ref/XP_007902871.1/ PREDICTED: uncharacterized protein LOC103185922 isoform X1 [Callorhinchus milii]
MAADGVKPRLAPEQFSGPARPRHPGEQQRVFTAVPFIVDFHRLLHLKNAAKFITGVSNQELVHTVTALYDVCLPNIGPEDLGATICARGTKTIILARDEKEVCEEYMKIARTSLVDIPDTKLSNQDEEEKPGLFSEVFSDSESIEEESETESDKELNEQEEKLKAGVKHFLKSVKKRRHQRYTMKENSNIPLTAIGMESRIVAAMSYERSVTKSGDRVVQLTLLSTRKRYRGCGVGRYLLQVLKDPAVVGKYDALLAHADSSAIKFFTHCGFSDDVMLNRKFKEFEDDWTYSTMMSYFPPFSLGNNTTFCAFPVEEKQIKLELQLWGEKSLAAYQAQAICMTKMLNEITALRTQIASQKELIDSLTSDLERAHDMNLQIEKKFLDYKVKKNREILQLSNITTEFDLSLGGKCLTDTDHLQHTIDSSDIQSSHKDDSLVKWSSAVDEYKLIEQGFADSMKKESGLINNQFEVAALLKANLRKETRCLIESCMTNMVEPMYRTTLYYCGGLECPKRIQLIMEEGFSEEDFTDGIYGQGLYFSPNGFTASLFSVPGSILVANVCIGNTETVMTKNRERNSPSKGFDSILVPGRLCDAGISCGSDRTQEYVIFNQLQALPVGLLKYRSTRS